MMQISTKTEYGLRCLLSLAREKEGESLSISEISQKEHVPKHYAHQILSQLRRAGLVKSIRGTEGGFILAQPAAAITVAQVVRVLEGVPFEDTCDHFNKHTDCGHLSACSIRPIWQIISSRLWEALDRITLHQLVDDEKTVGQKLELELPVLRFPV
jgi:Rrf2 family transcriptional regulator, cysteine metabolism repressor